MFTGCYITRKLGIQLSAVKSNPENCLLHFDNSNLDNDLFLNAEKYLLKAVESSLKCSIFDELRYHLYWSKGKSIAQLPLTSRSVERHIQQC